MNQKIYELYQDKSLSVIVPVYNEERKIQRNLHTLENELKQYFHNYEIIVVSDGSLDKTYEEALKCQSEKIKIYDYGVNVGKGYALKKGFFKSSGDYIIFIDGGMELHPKDIKVFLGLLDIYEMDAVIGSKRHPQSEVIYPLSRKILSRVYQTIIRLFLDLRVKDTQVGLKLFRREVLEKSLPIVLVKKYAFDLELLTVINRLGYNRILEAPVTLDFSHSVKKHFLYDLLHTLKVGWPLLIDTLAIIYRLRLIKYYDKRIKEEGLERKF